MDKNANNAVTKVCQKKLFESYWNLNHEKLNERQW